MKYSRIIYSSFLILLLVISAISFPNLNSTSNLREAFAETFQLEKEGGDYVTLTTNLPDDLNALTVAAWVTPDFTDGSSVMTIISQSNGFVLGINRNIDPKEIATFAVYDGSEWNTIESKSKIKEEITHVSATFGDASISIFINGELEATLSNIKTWHVSDRGALEEVPLTSLPSDYEIVVGATTNIKREQLKVSNEFSGIIHVVELYDTALDPSQIENLYLASFDVQQLSEAVEVVPGSVTIEQEQTQIETEVPEVQEFSASVILEESSTTNTIEEFQNGEIILSNDTIVYNETESDQTVDEIVANLWRISIKYTEIYGDGS